MDRIGTVILFVRAPRPGLVKTRLAKHIGNDAAAGVYRVLLRNALVQAEALRSEKIIGVDVAEDADTETLRAYAPWADSVRGQVGSDLGERMRNSFSRIFADGHGPIILMGSDIPDCNSDLLLHTQ